MDYLIEKINGRYVRIDQEDYDSFNRAAPSQGLFLFPSSGEHINISSISGIFPLDAEHLRQLSLRADTGVLHDGTKVFRKFGQWRDVRNPDATLDPDHYPEVARDEVAPTGVPVALSEYLALPAAAAPEPETEVAIDDGKALNH